MDFASLVKAALELGVIPALALFLVAAMFLQNRQLIKDRRDAEAQLLKTLSQVVSDYQKLVSTIARPTQPKESRRAQQ